MSRFSCLKCDRCGVLIPVESTSCKILMGAGVDDDGDEVCSDSWDFCDMACLSAWVIKQDADRAEKARLEAEWAVYDKYAPRALIDVTTYADSVRQVARIWRREPIEITLMWGESPELVFGGPTSSSSLLFVSDFHQSKRLVCEVGGDVSECELRGFRPLTPKAESFQSDYDGRLPANGGKWMVVSVEDKECAKKAVIQNGWVGGI